MTWPILEAWTTLSALAARTRRIRLGNLVTCNQFRYPSLLSKMSSTLDAISGGRLEFGIGACWFKEEAEAYGINFPKLGERVARLREAVKIVKLMWTQDNATFQGEYYSIKEAVNNPKPLQRPHPPVWIGGQSERFILPVAAELGDWTNLAWLSPEQCGAKIMVLDEECRNYGRRPEDLKKSSQIFIFVAQSDKKAEAAVRRDAERRRMSMEEFVKESNPVYGTPEECLRLLQRYLDVGISYFILVFPRAEGTESMELFVDRVAPSLR